MAFLTPRQQVWTLFFLAVFVMAIVLTGDVLHFRQYQSAIQAVLNSGRIVQSLDRLEVVLDETETGQRGYLLTGRQEYLEPYNLSKAGVSARFETVVRLLTDNSAQAKRLKAIRPQIESKLIELQRTVDLRMQGKATRALALVMTNLGEHLMRDIREKLAEVSTQEDELLAQRNRRLDQETKRRIYFMAVGTLTSLGLLLWMTLLLTKEIDRRWEAQARLEKVQDELQRHSADLTATNTELEAFCYSVSHDLRAPLRGIEGFSRIVLEKYRDKIDAEGQGYLERVRTGVKRMGQLIDDLLRLSRITRAEIRLQTVDLADIARSVAEDLRSAQPEQPVDLVIKESMPIQGDLVLLRTVLENLMGNAWKFSSKKKGSRVEVGEDESLEGRPFFVRDNGAGFDMAYRDKLFSAFQRLHSPGEFPGTGIGLATVQRVIHRHGGRVWAEGAVDQGATFYFTVKRSQPQEVIK